jgi:hypothetical protein
MKFTITIIFLLLSMTYGIDAFTQRIYNKSNEPVQGKIIFRPLFAACQPIDFEIAPGALKDIDTALCLIKEITIGSGPGESFIRGPALKGWTNTLNLTKTAKGPWKIDQEQGTNAK